MLAGDPEWMISRSVAHIATASMRTRISARAGTGVGLSRRKSSSGPPRTQTFIRSGIGNLADVVTPIGLYIAAFPRDLAFQSDISSGPGYRCNRFLGDRSQFRP